jgi:AcrR family transcriptional regulator
MKKKKSYHHGDLHSACIKEGLRLIKKNGFYDFSMRDIAKNLGVSHGAPYKHFETKENLLAAIAEEGFLILTNQVEQIKENSPKDSLESLFKIAVLYIQFGSDYPEYYKLMFGGIIKKAENYPSLFEASTKSYNTFKSLIKELIQSKKLLVTANSNLMTFYSWSLLHGLVSLAQDNRLNIAFVEANNDNSQKLMEELFSYVLQGVINRG